MPKKYNSLQKVAEKLLGGLLDRLDGWKSILGVVVALVAMIGHKMTWINAETAQALYEFAKWAFGIGILHKAVKR